MKIKFEKWHGARNDFILTWLPNDEIVFNSLVKKAPFLCNRDGSGIGADGIIILHEKSKDDLNPENLSVINSDGSIASTCGNGIRCACLSVLNRHKEIGNRRDLPDAVSLKLIDNVVVTGRFLGKKDGASNPLVAVDMGVPSLNEDTPFHKGIAEEVNRVAKELSMPELKEDFGGCAISNNHLVFFLNTVNRSLIQKVGPALQKSSHWDGINVHIVAPKAVTDEDRSKSAALIGSPIDDLFEVYIWERGAGETPACGSGASAIGALAFDSGAASRSSWLGIDMPGGRLFIKQEEKDDSVIMAGPGELVFTGTFDL